MVKQHIKIHNKRYIQAFDNPPIIIFSQRKLMRLWDRLLTKIKILKLEKQYLKAKQTHSLHNSYEIFRSLKLLANKLYELQLWSQASSYYELARSLFPFCRVTYNEKIEILDYLGFSYIKIKKNREAIDAFEQLKDICSTQKGQISSDVAWVWTNMAHCYGELGQHQQAIQLYEAAIEISIKVHGKKHYHVALYLTNLALKYFSMNDEETAEQKYLQAEEIWANIDKPRSFASFNCKYYLAKLYYRKGIYDRCLKQIYDFMKAGQFVKKRSEWFENANKTAITWVKIIGDSKDQSEVVMMRVEKIKRLL